MDFKPLKIGNKTAIYPIVQGGMGVGVSLGSLAGAVAKAGGVGTISAAQIGFMEPDFETNTKEANLRAIHTEYEKARAISPDGIVGFNLMVAMRGYEENVREVVKTGADFIVSGAGLPTELPEYVKGSDMKIAPIVSSAKSAKVILKMWDRKYNRTADFIVIEGPKAGGHLGFTAQQVEDYKAAKPEEAGSFEYEIGAILKEISTFEEKYETKIPVIVGGGITSREDAEKAFALGVDGIQVATKFVPTVECDVAQAFKEAYVNASKEDIMIVKSPVGMPGRAIANPFMKRVMAGEKFTPEKCLGCLHKCNPKEIPYCITERLINAAKGKTDEALLFCGADADQCKEITTVEQVVQSFFS